jgi:hypothetical protein
MEDDGDVIKVSGVASDDSVDSDDQIIDAEFAKKGLEKWLRTGGNVRVMHSVNLYPAGVGTEVENRGNSQWVTAEIVEPTAMKLVRKGVLRDFSVGISKPKIIRDRQARGGRVVDGVFSEISLVDRGSNHNTKFSICKMAANGNPEWLNQLEGDPSFITKALDAPDLTKNTKADISDVTGDTTDGKSLSTQDASHSFPSGVHPTDTHAHGMEDADGDSDGDGPGLACWDGDDPSSKVAEKAGTFSFNQQGGSTPPPPGGSNPATPQNNQQGNAQGGDQNQQGNQQGDPNQQGNQGDPNQQGGQGGPPPNTVPDGRKPCPTCNSQGSIHGPEQRCPTCRGQGHTVDDEQNSAPVASNNLGPVAQANNQAAQAKQNPPAPPQVQGNTQQPPPPPQNQQQKGTDADLAKLDYGIPTAGGDIQGAYESAPDMEHMNLTGDATQIAGHFDRSYIEPGHAADGAGEGIRGNPVEAVKGWAADIAKARNQAQPQTDTNKKDVVPEDTQPQSAPEALVTKAQSEPDYAARRLHDALCPCYDWNTVVDVYPALKGQLHDIVKDTKDVYFRLLMQSIADGTEDSAPGLAGTYYVASKLADIDRTLLDDARAELHKATCATMGADDGGNGQVPPHPSDPPKPGSFTRPFLSAGHYRENADSTHRDFPSAAHVPAASDFNRDNLTTGHEADSPANKAADNTEKANRAGVPAPGSPASAVYGAAQRDAIASVILDLHDHVVSPFPQFCNMTAPVPLSPSSSKSLDMQVGVPAKELSVSDTQAFESKGADLEPAITKSAARDILAPEITEYETKIADLQAMVDEYESAPSVAQAPFRGVVAVNRAVHKRDANQAEKSAAELDSSAEVELLKRYLASGNSEMRLRAEERLAKIAQ